MPRKDADPSKRVPWLRRLRLRVVRFKVPGFRLRAFCGIAGGNF